MALNARNRWCNLLLFYLNCWHSQRSFPMSDRTSSVRLSVRLSSFFKSNRPPQFSSNLVDSWRECAQQYYPKSCLSKVFNFLCWGIFNYKKYAPILAFSCHFLKKSVFLFLIWDHETWFTGILCVLSGVCEKRPLWDKFSCPFGKIGQYKGFRPLSSNVSAWFTWNCIYKLIGTTFGGV